MKTLTKIIKNKNCLIIKDSVTISVDAVVYLRIFNPLLSVNKVYIIFFKITSQDIEDLTFLTCVNYQ